MKEKNIITEISKKSFKKKLKKIKSNISLLNNRYYLGDEIGKGGLSTVYSATDIYCDYFNEPSNIVIKIPSNKLQKNKDIAAFVYSEYSFLKRLNHDNIVKALDFGIDEESNIPYVVLEYLKGSILSEVPIISMNKDFKNQLFKTLLNTIHHIHSQNIVHADINPSNIMINKEFISLFDFGISQDTNKNKEITLEYSKVKAYNPKYSAPEILQGEKPNKQSDIFSLACVMYEIYNCKSLFNKNSLDEIKNNKYAYDLSNIPFVFRRWFKNSLDINPHKRVLPQRFLNFFK
ncbi:serine/threonine-protein kinase [Arcobacter sp. LA11]|uniref:serine/threonine-protein kinase n=1 Tax=Arcobacter sp. LA11 TaxID=1898176 RepID=UPI000932A89F|nr:serine/threonine-protein kinase [Arcobacter sp. LA11]